MQTEPQVRPTQAPHAEPIQAKAGPEAPVKKSLSRLLRSFYVHRVPASVKFRIKSLQCTLWPRPMMSKAEVSFFTSLLSVGDVAHVVEFGSGGSTLYYPKMLPEGGTWSSIESHAGWFELIKKHVLKCVHMYLADEVSAVDAEFMTALAGADLVLIDGGEDRSRIMDLVRELNPTALVVLHDSWRDSYAEAASRFDRVIKVTRPYGVGAEGPRSAGGMTLLMQDASRARS